MDDALPASYESTRRALHAVAEHVLAAALHQATGRIGLRVTQGGFGTPVFPRDGIDHQVRVEGVELVVRDRDGERRAPLRTVAEATAFAGVEPGGPAGVYTLVTPLEPDVELAIDAASAAVVHRWFDRIGAALAELAARHPDDEPSPAQLWPEHFDLAISMAEVNYGGSPGDDEHPGPYLYVGPWDLDRSAHPLWNESFGMSRSSSEVGDVAAAVALFEAGRTATLAR